VPRGGGQRAQAAGLRRPATLFLNAEPEALEIPVHGPIRESGIAAGTELQLCIEITERALTARPAELLAAVDRLRREGSTIARWTTSVWTRAHWRCCPCCGPTSSSSTSRSSTVTHPAQRPLIVGRKDVLLSVTRPLEAQALELGGHTVVVSTFQHVRHFTPATARRYTELARRGAFTAALGIGLGPEPGVRGISLDDDNVLAGEWASRCSARTTPAPWSRATSETPDPTVSAAFPSC